MPAVLRGRLAIPLVLVTAAAAFIAACGQTVPGAASALSTINPNQVAGLPVSNGPSGPRSGATNASLNVTGSDGGAMDILAQNALSDIQDFWTQTMPAAFGGMSYRPVTEFYSYDSAAPSTTLCESSTQGLVNAFYCPSEDSVAWDRSQLLPFLDQDFSPLAVVTVFAHEMGHAVQYRLGKQAGITQNTITLVKEQQADCFAGAFSHWMAAGNAKHFTLNTGAGLNKILATLMWVRDVPGEGSFDQQGAHGTAFDRIYAFEQGFTTGATRCAKINEAEVASRVTEQAFTVKEQNQNNGNAPLTDVTLALLTKSLNRAFSVSNGPKLVTGNGSCSSATGTPPVSYCAASNSVNMDLTTLRTIAAKPQKTALSSTSKSTSIGDFAAFAEIASRYVLAMEAKQGKSTEGTTAGLRTACLVGQWAQFATKPGPTGETTLRMAVGDLDKAIQELLTDTSLIATDATGTKVPSGFARVAAFQAGFLNGSC